MGRNRVAFPTSLARHKTPTRPRPHRAPYFDGEFAFNLLIERLLDETQERGRGEDWLELARLVRQLYPAEYAEESKYLARYEVQVGLFGDRQNLDGAIAGLLGRPEDNFDHILDALDELAYHGVVDDLPDQLRIGWPEIQDSPLSTSRANE